MKDVVASTLLGHSPTPSDVEQTKKLITQSEGNIARMESQIKDLECRCANEREIIASLRQAIAPIWRLPPELLREIFQIDFAVASLGRWETPVKAILRLGQVCTHWRWLVHTTPQLWAGLLVIDRITKPSDAYIAGIKNWVERSAPLAIPVSIALNDLSRADAAPLMDVLLGATHRWQTLHIFGGLLVEVTQIPAGALKELEEVYIWTEEPHARVDTFVCAPRLRSVTLTAPHIELFPMPWTQLTQVNLNKVLPELCIRILMQCMNLAYAELHIDAGIRPDIPAFAENAALAQLHTLFLYFSEPSSREQIIPFLRCLELPALKALELGISIRPPWPTEAVTQFLSRAPNIEEMAIVYSSLSSDDLQAVLRHVPSLNSLNIANCWICIDDAFLRALRYSVHDPTPLAPRLVGLSFFNVGNEFQDASLEEMIQSRWWSDAELRAMAVPPAVARWETVSYCGGLDDDEVEDGQEFNDEFNEKLDAYRVQGLDVDVRKV
ncbi:hypothetical protein B0H10DRAFT_824476 [Mycena sp. CBHHK59/15]|nr:hypothetical protein B0H10DRAFT_824476 [Mycena sp. CBHHK59/15]